MSRYTYFVDDVECVVGWDGPLETFFVQVNWITDEDGEEMYEFSLGQVPMEIPDWTTFIQSMKFFGAKIPYDILYELSQSFEMRRPPTATQLRGRELARFLLEEMNGESNE